MKKKKEIILVFLLLNSFAMIAQNNQIKIGGGIGMVPYQSALGWNVDVQYEYKINSQFSGFIGAGMIGSNFTTRGRSQGTDGTDTWDNSWQFQYSERFQYIDLGLKYSILKRERYEMKTAFGGSLAQSIFKYPPDVYINRGIVEQENEVSRKVEIGMLLLGLENYVYLTDRFFLNLNLRFRTLFKEKHVLIREIKSHNNSGSVRSGILNVTNLNLQIGYLF